MADRILFIGPSNVGDGVLVTDALAAVHRKYPRAQIGLVVGERAAMIFEGDDRIEKLWPIDGFEGALGRLRLAVELFRFRPDVCVDLRGTVYPILLTPKRFYRFLRQPPKQMKHMYERHLWKLRAQLPEVGEAIRSEVPGLWRNASDAARVAQLWARWRLSEALPVVIICPGARSHIKRWTAEGFATVADRLIEKHQAQVIFSGEIAENEIIDNVMEHMSRPAFSAVGMLTVRQLAWVMKRADIVLTNDSASLHLASNVGAPTVAIFGPTDEAQYGPLAPLNQTIRRQLFCTPCRVAQCQFHHECMRFISAEEVYGAMENLLLKHLEAKESAADPAAE